jgi:hypothetical protein
MRFRGCTTGFMRQGIAIRKDKNMSTAEPPSDPSPGEPKNLSPTKSDATVEAAPTRPQDPVPSQTLRRMEQFSAMMQFSPGRDPLVEKMTTEHVTAVIANKDKDGERHHQEELAKIASHRWYFGGAIVSVLALCWLFLWYGKTEHLDAVLAAIVGLAGGFGLGRATAKDKHES